MMPIREWNLAPVFQASISSRLRKIPRTLLFLAIAGMFLWAGSVAGQPTNISLTTNGSSQLAPTTDSDSSNLLSPGQSLADEFDTSPIEGAAARQNRVLIATLIGSTILLLMILAFVYLRLEHASRGFYSGKLQAITVLAGIIILATSLLVFFLFLTP